MAGEQPSGQAPEWFARNISAPRQSGRVDVEACSIHYLQWGERSRPGLLFIPPSGGHAHWFAHVAPFFADQFNVVAMDPAGCGDSGRRSAYTQQHINQEILAVCEHAGMFAAESPPVLVGHSAGAQWVLRTAREVGERFLGVIAVDGLRYDELEKDHAVKVLKDRKVVAARPPRIYPTQQEALSRFRLAPSPLQEIVNTWVVDYIAEHSYREVEGGWVSKYDPQQGATIDLALELRDILKDLACHSAAIYAENTHLAEADVADRVGALNDFAVPVFIIPGTSHYPQIDQPQAFVTAIKGVVLTWLAGKNR